MGALCGTGCCRSDNSMERTLQKSKKLRKNYSNNEEYQYLFPVKKNYRSNGRDK